MYAVIETGGKQYRVAVGDKVKVEKLNVEAGDDVTLDRVLMIQDDKEVKVGTPTLSENVSARVVSHGRGEKIRIFKMKRRKNYRKQAGHRQDYTELEITGIA
ncbi:MAG: 50S ribosomal protein L21 [Gammaproteobacteria bacterium]|nr:MAG: 50S ribosomal protein L21 [Gammaproteobacteria bacterium]